MAASCTEGGLPKGKSGDVHQLKLRRRHSCTQSVAQPKPVLIYPDYRLPFKLTTDARRPVGTTQQHGRSRVREQQHEDTRRRSARRPPQYRSWM